MVAGDDAIVPAPVAPVVPNIRDILALAEVEDEGRVEMTQETLSTAKFFKVVASDLSRRFQLHDDYEKSICIHVQPLSSVSISGAEATFTTTPGPCRRLNLLKLLREHTVPEFLQQLVVWKDTGGKVHWDCELPLVGVRSSIADVEGGPETIQALMNFEDGCAMYDTMSGTLVSTNNVTKRSPVSLRTLSSLKNIGLVEEFVSEFGEGLWVVVHENLKWIMGVACSSGSRKCFDHVQEQKPKGYMHCEKLEILMVMHSKGWRPFPGAAHAPYAIGEGRHYVLNLKAAKWYFSCLAIADDVLCRLPLEAGLPIIRHGMPQHYYSGLVMLKDPVKLMQLLALVDAGRPPRDKELAALVDQPSDDDNGDEGEAPDAVPLPPFPALPPVPGNPGGDSPGDLRNLLSIARQVLHPVPADQIDLTETFPIAFRGRPITVHFDGCSHASGKQRAFVACCNRTGPTSHHRCFKYGFVHLWPDKQTAAAWLTAWAWHGTDDFNKADHAKFKPPDAEVEEAKLLFPNLAGE